MNKILARMLTSATIWVLAVLSLASVSVADSVNFSSQGSVTVSNNGNNGIGFSFSPASVSGATPWDDSLNNFTAGDNPFLIGSDIVLNGSGVFTTASTSVQIGDAENNKTGLFTGNINFITIASGGGPGSFTINISLSNVSYSCNGTVSEGGCQGSGVLSALALSGQGFLSFTFGFDNGPQDMDQLLRLASGGGQYSSDGFNGTLNTDAPVGSDSVTDGAAVPEPASLALFGSGLLTCAGFARRKFRI